MAANFLRTGSAYTLTGDQAASLVAGGLEDLAYDSYTLVPTAAGIHVAIVNDLWESGFGSANDWAANADVRLKIDLESSCPIPVDSDFTYYVAFVKAFNDGSPAILIGTACPEDGILNP